MAMILLSIWTPACVLHTCVSFSRGVPVCCSSTDKLVMTEAEEGKSQHNWSCTSHRAKQDVTTLSVQH